MKEGQVSKAMHDRFYPLEGEDLPPKRVTILVDGEVHHKVQQLSELLHLSWARTVNFLLLPAVNEALEWAAVYKPETRYEGLDPELVDALVDEENPRHEEALQTAEEARQAALETAKRVVRIQA